MATNKHTGRVDDWPGIHIFTSTDPTRPGVYRVRFGWGLAPVVPAGTTPPRMPRFPLVVVTAGPPVAVEDYEPGEQPLPEYTDDDFRQKSVAIVTDLLDKQRA